MSDAELAAKRGVRPSTRIELMHPMIVELMKRMTSAERIQRASAMHRSAREMLTNHVRSLHPDWDETQIAGEVRRRMLGGTK